MLVLVPHASNPSWGCCWGRMVSSAQGQPGIPTKTRSQNLKLLQMNIITYFYKLTFQTKTGGWNHPAMSQISLLSTVIKSKCASYQPSLLILHLPWKQGKQIQPHIDKWLEKETITAFSGNFFLRVLSFLSCRLLKYRFLLRIWNYQRAFTRCFILCFASSYASSFHVLYVGNGMKSWLPGVLVSHIPAAAAWGDPHHVAVLLHSTKTTVIYMIFNITSSLGKFPIAQWCMHASQKFNFSHGTLVRWLLFSIKAGFHRCTRGWVTQEPRERSCAVRRAWAGPLRVCHFWDQDWMRASIRLLLPRHL